MYLTIDTYNNINDLPEEKNFSKPYLIKGGCKKMDIFKKYFLMEINENGWKKYLYDRVHC